MIDILKEQVEHRDHFLIPQEPTSKNNHVKIWVHFLFLFSYIICLFSTISITYFNPTVILIVWVQSIIFKLNYAILFTHMRTHTHTHTPHPEFYPKDKSCLLSFPYFSQNMYVLPWSWKIPEELSEFNSLI